MRIFPRASRSGVALIIVMIAIFVLSVLVGAFAYAMKVETKLAMNANHEVESTWTEGQSGVSWARCILAEQAKCRYDSLDQKWAKGPGGECDTNGFLSDIDLNNLPVDMVGKKSISIDIVDLDRFINVNFATQPPNDSLLNQTLIAVGVNVSDIPPIAEAIKDWVDPDDLTVNGAESDDYQRMDPPYYAKNKPIDDLSELLLVRGVTPDMYSRDYERSPVQQKDRFGRPVEVPEHPVHLDEVWTPLSSGRVNINTAPKDVLTIIFNGDDQAADRVITTRATTPAGSPSCPDAQTLLLNSGFSPAAAADLQGRIFIIKSTVFRVGVSIKGSSRKFFAIIGRGNTPQDTKILGFFWRDQ